MIKNFTLFLFISSKSKLHEKKIKTKKKLIDNVTEMYIIIVFIYYIISGCSLVKIYCDPKCIQNKM